MATPITGTSNFVQVVNGSPLQYQYYQASPDTIVGGDTFAVPGLYGQGSTILNAHLIGTGATLANYFRVEAYGNTGTTAGSGVTLLGTLYSSLGTGAAFPGAQLASKLGQDCWLTMAATENINSTNVGLCVQFTSFGANTVKSGVPPGTGVNY